MEMKNDNYIGINAFGAQVGVTVTGLDKPLKAVGRGLKTVFGLSRSNIHKGAKFLAAKTE